VSIWIAVAAVGGLLCLIALFRLGVALRRGRITPAFFVAALVAVLSFVAFALVDNLSPDGASAAVTLATLLPGCVGIVVIVREQRRAGARPR